MEKLDFTRIHRFSQGGLNLLLDINSGAIHLIDGLTAALLDAVEAHGSLDTAAEQLVADFPPGELAEVAAELEALIAEGTLFSPPVEDLNVEMQQSEPVVKALCLHIAHDCNLRCGYCFAGTGAFGGDRSLMSEEVGKQALEFLFVASGNRKHVEVDFFGGEPLMNFSVVKMLTAYGYKRAAELGKIIKFTLTTNGVLLNKEVQDFLLEQKISAVLSLDGRREVHDRMRPAHNAKGSYDICVKHFSEFVGRKETDDYYLRGTYTAHNIDFAADIKHIHGLGFEEISMEPVVAAPSDEYALRDADLDALKKEYELLAEYCRECHDRDEFIRFFHFNIDLSGGPCLIKRLSGCGAGSEYLAVSPQGELYPCHQFVGMEEYMVGNVDDGIGNTELCAEFQEAHVLNKEECLSCWARFYCSGGCHASNLNFRNSLHKPYLLGCELQKKRLECALYLAAHKQLNPKQASR